MVLPVADTIFELVDRMAQYGKPVLLAEAGVDIQGLEENREGDPEEEVVAHVLSGRATLLAWVRNAAHEYFTPDRSLVEGAVFAPPLAVDGSWVGEWIDPWSGAVLGVVDVQAEEPHRTPELTVPPFSRDVALRLDHAPVPKK